MASVDFVKNVEGCMSSYGEYSERFFALLPVCGQENVLKWCMKEGLIASSYECPECGSKMKLVKSKKVVNDGHEWICRKQTRENAHNVSRSVRNNSWFAMSNLDMCTILGIMRKWFGSCPQNYTMVDMHIADHTVVDWYMFCREVCMQAVLIDSSKIGGRGTTVEVDESKFGKMKYGKGRRVEGNWVFGGVERGTNKCFFKVVENRSKESLLAVIKEWVLPGTTIISDCWKAYDCLKDEGFVHLKVNHSLEYVDPVTGAHTNTIEGIWAGIKRFMRNNTNHVTDMFDSYLFEYMWRKSHGHSLQDAVFKAFLKDVGRVYTPAEKDLMHRKKRQKIDEPGPSTAI